jgi:hypothetical protein
MHDAQGLQARARQIDACELDRLQRHAAGALIGKLRPTQLGLGDGKVVIERRAKLIKPTFVLDGASNCGNYQSRLPTVKADRRERALTRGPGR